MKEVSNLKAGLKSSGFVRHLDDLGRLVLPAEWRRTFGLTPGVPMELLLNGDGTVVIRRYVPTGTCTFCGETENLGQFQGRLVCQKCTVQLAGGVGA